MTVVTKYPTSIINYGNWLTANNIKADDADCALKATAVAGTYTILCSGYGFAIPAGSTISQIRIFIDGNVQRVISVDDRYMVFTLAKTGASYSVQSNNYQTAPTCAKSTKDYYILLAGALTVAQLNAESFTTTLDAVLLDTQSTSFYCDCVGIEVTYTEPSAEKDAFDGLAFAT